MDRESNSVCKTPGWHGGHVGQLQTKSLTSLQMLTLNPAEGGVSWVNILLIGGQGRSVRIGTECLKYICCWAGKMCYRGR